MAETRPHAGLFAELQKFNKNKMKPTETRVTRNYAQAGAEQSAGAGTAFSEERMKEIIEADDVLQAKATELASLMRNKKTVVYTGAGVSTSAKIPDYRGPNGVWTLAAKGIQSKMGMQLESALPTYTHMALKKLVDEGMVSMIVSTNIDGLHRRSGVPKKNMAELHGNVYKEVCGKCGYDYIRPWNVTKNTRNRFTGRLCERACCSEGIKLRDSIVNFGENLPENELTDATKASKECDVALVLGSSMSVSPACLLPTYTQGDLVIVNLQITDFDKRSSLRVFGKCDEFMKMLMEELELKIDEFDETKYIEEVKRQLLSIKEDPDFADVEEVAKEREVLTQLPAFLAGKESEK